MSEIFFTERGSGSSVILLHGFPFHSAIWEGFAEKLGKEFKIYTPDLPGFGKSKGLGSNFTIEKVAQEIISWIEKNKIGQSVLLGHSLGGYVALAVAEKNPELLSGLILFHSTAYADNEEKKQSRNKVIEFIDKNGAEAFTSNFIAPLFYNQKHPAIEKVRAIAIQAKADTVKGYTLAMRDREDRTNILKIFPHPILFIGGENDGGIKPESLKEQASIATQSQLYIFPEVAHMGMFENEKKSLEIISAFIRKVPVTR